MTYLVAKTFPGVSKGTTKLKMLQPSFFFKLRTYGVEYKEKHRNPVLLPVLKMDTVSGVVCFLIGTTQHTVLKEFEVDKNTASVTWNVQYMLHYS